MPLNLNLNYHRKKSRVIKTRHGTGTSTKQNASVRKKALCGFELDITDSGKTAHLDSQPSQLRRALSNIINNAVDALPENRNGVITVLVDANEN